VAGVGVAPAQVLLELAGQHSVVTVIRAAHAISPPEAYRPFWNAQRETPAAKHNGSPFWELEEFIEQGSAIIGSPEQVLDKIHRFTSGFGQQLTGISVDSLPFAWQREQLEWFAADIAPELRRSYPNSLWT
jgi:hypothetical protein